MAKKQDMPVYLFTGFLEAGKTRFIQETLEDKRFCNGEKTLLLPCVQGDDLVLRRYMGPECMVSGEQFGIGEPTGPEWTDLGAVELIVVPGVAFDSEGNRMGRGRGFYDRLLKSTPRAAKVGVAYDFQMLDHIATEPHDVRMDRVITES